jgi:putative ABC transport system permease protein
MLGVLFTLWGINLLSFFVPKTYLPIDLSSLMNMNWQVMTYMLGITLLTGFSVVPALQNLKTDLNSALKEGGHYSSGTSGSHRLSILLVVAETALAVVVLIGAVLCCKSFKSVLAINPDFDPKNLLLAGIQLSAREYDEDHGRAFYRRLLERLQGMAGVEGTCLGSWVHLGFEDKGAPAIEVEGMSRYEDRGARDL